MVRWSCILLPFALLACGDDSSSGDDGAGGSGATGGSGVSQGTGGEAPCTRCCETALAITGTIDGAAMPTADDRIDSVWFNESLDEIVLGPIDEAVMDELGLDPDDQADVERYRYLVMEADYRFLAGEEGPPDEDGLTPYTKDITVFYFDLAGHPADLDHAVPIFDLTAVEEARDSGSREALGDALRVAADAIRDNGHPDVVVAYAADRSDEGLGNVLVSLLSPTARLASGGEAWIHGVIPEEGDAIPTLAPPLPPLSSVSIRVEPSFPEPDDAMRIEATCLPVTMSGE